jgi:Flp pilus assembly protein TadD
MLALSAGLTLAVLFVYAQTAEFGFLAIDDRSYVSDNPHVLGGLSRSSLAWALTTRAETHWAPMTWISLMLDAQIWGPSARGFHITNLVLHLANTLLFFLFFVRVTRRELPSAFTAALFGIHPLHVESVAWVTERKDVLSAFFFALALLAYARYAARPAVSRYILVFALLALAMMAKSMLVTAPILLLLLDYWPLSRGSTSSGDGFRSSARAPSLAPSPTDAAAARTHGARKSATSASTSSRPPQPGTRRFRWPARALVLEKVPMLALSAGAAVLAVRGQAESGTLASAEQFPAGVRLANAAASCAGYLVKTILPMGLAIPYPYLADRLTVLRVGISALLIAVITVLVIRLARRFPYLFTGWLWYLVALLPVIGLVQAGAQSMADRYTYIPLIGLFLILGWGAPDLLERLLPRLPSETRARALGGIALVVVITLTVAAKAQASYWRSTSDLVTHTIAVTGPNALAHNALGITELENGHLERAQAEEEEALRIWPSYSEAHLNLAAVLDRERRNSEALTHYKEAARLRPADAETLARFGAALLASGSSGEAIEAYRRALAIDPDRAEARAQLGTALAQEGRGDEALEELRLAARERPSDADVRIALGTELAKLGRLDEAASALSEAARLAPSNPSAHKNLGVVLARQGRLAEAAAQFSEAVRLDPADEGSRLNLERARRMLGSPN